ncbi:MAG: hypothetical protein RPR97_19540 [Colwellia sp.]|jgi:ATPases involved in chromosome partitioning
MSKIEQAIRKTSGDRGLLSSLFGHSKESCMAEIEKMQDSYIIEEEALKNKKIIFKNMKDRNLLNSFRGLRTSISTENNKNIIMVTSVCDGSGTSFFTINLASATAMDPSKTALLIDCNLRNRDASDLFGLSEKNGISEYISSPQLEVGNIIYESGLKRLRVLPYGSKNLTVNECFSHPKFHNLLGEIKYRYQERNVFIDSPPILKCADTSILLELCDQVILVVGYGKSCKSEIESACKLIGKEKLRGIVFNDYI